MLARADHRRLSDILQPQRFDLVHVHRLYMLPLLQSDARLQRVPACIDLDDVESVTRERLSSLARSNGDGRLAHVMQRDAEAYAVLERNELGRFERVYVCSNGDRARLLAQGGARRVDVMPNVVEIPDLDWCRPRAQNDPFVFLFVGDQSYYPNGDAVAFLIREIVPLIRRRVSQPFTIRIVSRSLARWQGVREAPEVSWAPPDVDLGQEYRCADAALIPLRAGGGTRIKALEAFAHRTATVSTPIGIDGLAVEHGEHLLIGETAAELADHAALLMEDAALRSRLEHNAFRLVRAEYGPAAVLRCIDDMDANQPGVAEQGCAGVGQGAG